MRRLFLVSMVFLLGMATAANAQSTSLEGLIAEYETFAQTSDPDAQAQATDTEPQRWADVTPEAVSERAAIAADILARVEQLEEPGPGPEAAILRHLLQQAIDAHRYDTMRIPLSGDWGFFSEPAYAARQTRITNREDADAWIARLNDIPRYFAENKDNMRRGMATGWTAHSDPLATSINQVREQIYDNVEETPLYAPFLSLPDDMNLNEVSLLQTRGRVAASNAIASYRALLIFLETEYAPLARPQAGIGSLPGGLAAYDAAIVNYTAGSGYSVEDVHEIGKQEVVRIRAAMEDIIQELEFEGSFEDFTNFLRTDPQFYAQTPEELLEKAAEMSKRLDAMLPRYFSVLPRLTYGVEAVPADIAPGYTTGRYSSGDLKRGFPGTYLVNTYALDQRPLYELPALSAHEAVPGHHLQISLAREQDGVSEFRKSYYATAFGEGWGLYAEKLAGEAGIYRTPYERFGQLSYEMWRACRLVADTGLHAYGWTREQAEACFTDNTALAPLNIQTEVTRYIGWPGQATAYKVGELKILDLRAMAKDALAEAFDIRAFHDHLLGAGAMPLDALEARMTSWVQETERTAP